eukprot:CAMPEP_0202854790 /NCGR_PEP_ID=MMETSP1389-20130828/91180_1 /ASSEMBLY_ACC=CAM_ASM_000865 /TAXON_ID=302021 /ORGANISM="Rhodomonas sp., Strain CCMP768" /LENGTH=175 /DNA_ID=CAMNT_0049533389 /DNA_START=5 /DNA_END=532 /DNA_ORIENTATION=-
MTLWAAVIARELLGFAWDDALSLGSTVSALNARSKGFAIRGQNRGSWSRGAAKGADGDKKKDDDMVDGIVLLGRTLPARKTPDGVRGWLSDKAMEPKTVDRSLRTAFKGDALSKTFSIMLLLARRAAKTIRSDSRHAYQLYEQFRPEVAAGTAGWGKAGELKLDAIRDLANDYPA